MPVFWSESLAVQSAGGKQRKVLFFRVGDLQHMWRNLADARKKAGDEGDPEDPPMPEGPVVQVSDLQTMAAILVDAKDHLDRWRQRAALVASKGSGHRGAHVHSSSRYPPQG